VVRKAYYIIRENIWITGLVYFCPPFTQVIIKILANRMTFGIFAADSSIWAP
jgi:hypothetical protein